MNMPGFTAQSSAYKTRGHYRHYQMDSGFTSGFTYDSANVVQPQACDLACLGECREGCVGLTGRKHAVHQALQEGMWLRTAATNVRAVSM
jgi:hypothetical protein